jgi:tetratricopeptide (TPR) repeat protein
MAIDKIRKKKIEISPLATIQFGISSVLVVLSLVFGYLAFVKWRFKVNLVSGYESFDTNELEAARNNLKTALSWKPDHRGARELLAKIQCDTNQLDESLANYSRLLELGYAEPQVHAGLGAVFLKKADKAADAKEVAPLLKQARDYFEKAAGVAEGAVGLGHCDLLQAERQGVASDLKRFDAALQRFRKIREELNAKPDYRARCSSAGVVDFYAGLGKALSASAVPEDHRAASAAFRAWYQLGRRAVTPMCNILAVETRRFDGRTYSQQEMMALKPEAQALRREMDAWKLQKDAYRDVKEPWLQYTLALAKAFLDAGSDAEYENLIRELGAGAGFENRLDVFLFDAGSRTARVLRDEAAPNLDQYVQKTSLSYKALLSQSAIKDESAKLVRALAYNNMGWMEAWSGSWSVNEQRLKEAQIQLTEAVKLFPDDYIFNRNLCVVLRRLRRPDREVQPYLDKAKAAPKGALEEDFVRFEQYMGAR